MTRRYLSTNEIQAAWCKTANHRDVREYRLTTGGEIVCSDDPAAGLLIGCYDGRVTLRDFRNDVRATAKEAASVRSASGATCSNPRPGR